jgi:hypothetical protein
MKNIAYLKLKRPLNMYETDELSIGVKLAVLERLCEEMRVGS